MRRLLSLLLLSAALTACRPDVFSPRDVGGGVHAQLETNGLRVDNRTGAAIYYFAIEANAAAVALWIPCTDPPGCSKIDAHSSVVIPFERIALWQAEARTALFYWWRLVPAAPGSFKPDSIRSIRANQ